MPITPCISGNRLPVHGEVRVCLPNLSLIKVERQIPNVLMWGRLWEGGGLHKDKGKAPSVLVSCSQRWMCVRTGIRDTSWVDALENQAVNKAQNSLNHR